MEDGARSIEQPSESTPQRKVLAVCAAVVLVLVAIAVIVGTWGSATAGSVEFELRKYLIQFLLIVAVGAVVAFVVDDLKRRTDRADDARRLRREAADRERQYAIETVSSLLARLDVSYSKVKRTRRLSRLVPVSELSRDTYMEAMSKLSDDKADIEQLKRDIATLGSWLTDLKELRPVIDSMETYLGRVEDEWEEVAPAEFLPESLDAFRKLVLKTKDGSDFYRFRDPYREARSTLTILLAKKRANVGLIDVESDSRREEISAISPMARTPRQSG